jgi:hypothetical protein
MRVKRYRFAVRAGLASSALCTKMKNIVTLIVFILLWLLAAFASFESRPITPLNELLYSKGKVEGMLCIDNRIRSMFLSSREYDFLLEGRFSCEQREIIEPDDMFVELKHVAPNKHGESKVMELMVNGSLIFSYDDSREIIESSRKSVRRMLLVTLIAAFVGAISRWFWHSKL